MAAKHGDSTHHDGHARRDGDRPTPITGADVARELGLSQSTVSRALRRDPRVAPATMRRVLAAADRLHYTPHIAARNLITRRSRTIGVVVSDIRNPFYPELVDSLHNEFALAGYRTVLLNERTDAQLDRHVAELASGGAIDGIVYTSALLDAPLLGGSRAAVPLVLLNRVIDADTVDKVVSDNRLAGQLAARMLLDHGHRRIAFIAGPENTSTSRDREAGLVAELARAGLRLDPRLRRSGVFSHASGNRCGAELLAADPRPTAIVAGNDVIAFGALDAARRLGLDVPGELSVVGFDDIEMAGWDGYCLTTVEQRLSEMAQTAARLLLERIECADEMATRSVVFSVRVVHRATVGPAPGT